MFILQLLGTDLSAFCEQVKLWRLSEKGYIRDEHEVQIS